MNPGFRLSRRTLMRIAVALGAGCGSVASSPARSIPLDPVAERVLSVVHSLAPLSGLPLSEREHMGEFLLREVPDGSNPTALIDLLGGRECILGRSRAEQRRTLIRRHREDLEAGRIVTPRGWILSRTEALVYALATSRCDGGQPSRTSAR